MTDSAQQAGQEIFAAFAGNIDQASVQKIFQGFGSVMTNNVTSVHLLFQSAGGFIGDGVCLYNFFRALPVQLTLYNTGSVCSAGVIAYLGAKKRKTSAHAAFMVHRTQSPAQPATAQRLQAIAHSVTIDDQRTEAILREHVTLTEEKWTVHGVADLWLSAKEAVESGIAHEIGEFAPPLGQQVYIVG